MHLMEFLPLNGTTYVSSFEESYKCYMIDQKSSGKLEGQNYVSFIQ